MPDVRHAAACRVAAVIERTEWRVVGDPGPDYPPYAFTFHDEDEARGFVALARERGQWLDGPHLDRRTVIETAWERVDPECHSRT